MIFRSIIVCAVCLAVWQAVLPSFRGRHHATPGLPRQNAARVQHYVHDVEPDAVVIVGSSMADRLDERVLGGSHAKLTFPAGGALTGLEIVRAGGRVPRVCWIETNMVPRGVDGDLVAEAWGAWRVPLRETSPVFRETGRPSGYAVGMLMDGLKKTRGWYPAGAAPDPAVREAMLRETRVRLATPPPGRELAESLARLAAAVEELGGAGCECVFFEMPMDAGLRDLAGPQTLRRALDRKFPRTKYRWFTPVKSGAWDTTDGVHLSAGDAALVAEQMAAFEATLPSAKNDGKRIARRL